MAFGETIPEHMVGIALKAFELKIDTKQSGDQTVRLVFCHNHNKASDVQGGSVSGRAVSRVGAHMSSTFSGKPIHQV